MRSRGHSDIEQGAGERGPSCTRQSVLPALQYVCRALPQRSARHVGRLTIRAVAGHPDEPDSCHATGGATAPLEHHLLRMPTNQTNLPGTLERSPPKAQRTYRKVHNAAKRQYGDAERAHRTAFSALKHSFEKVGDHWEKKSRKGPSDPRSTKSTREKRRGEGETYGGVDLYGNTKKELYERARRLGIDGRSHMSKRQLARAISKAQ